MDHGGRTFEGAAAALQRPGDHGRPLLHGSGEDDALGRADEVHADCNAALAILADGEHDLALAGGLGCRLVGVQAAHVAVLPGAQQQQVHREHATRGEAHDVPRLPAERGLVRGRNLLGGAVRHLVDVLRGDAKLLHEALVGILEGLILADALVDKEYVHLAPVDLLLGQLVQALDDGSSRQANREGIFGLDCKVGNLGDFLNERHGDANLVLAHLDLAAVGEREVLNLALWLLLGLPAFRPLLHVLQHVLALCQDRIVGLDKGHAVLALGHTLPVRHLGEGDHV
mmetsp:Transcript_113279/g.331091  ORF Transcript_113279/g.331091 Transcript_113279/m.331091 type:complete len:285 (+) Transcript_113279:1249-2103(+)